MEIKKDKREFEVTATKLPTYMREWLRQDGQSAYEVLQKAAELYLLLWSKEGNIPEQYLAKVREFQQNEGWRKQFCLAEFDNPQQVTEATYFIKSTKGEGCRGMHVTEPYFGDWQATFNQAQILETTISHLMPRLYRLIRRVGALEECESAEEVIDLLCRQYLKNYDDSIDIMELFKDNDRSEFGQKPVSEPYRQAKKRGEDNTADRRRAEGQHEQDNTENNTESYGTLETLYADHAEQGMAGCEEQEDV